MLINIGYAAISTNLKINGTANIHATSWNVYFTNIQTAEGSIVPTSAPETIGTETTELNWSVSMDTPGQFYEFDVDVVNGGTINAMIGNLSNSTLTTEQAQYLNYTVTYSDGAIIEKYDKLKAGNTETLKVRLEFKKDIEPEDLPAMEDIILLNYESNYVQADSNAKARNRIFEIGDTINYTTTLNNVTLDNWKVFYKDGDYVYLILADYMPNSAINTDSLSGITKSGTYGISANTDDNRIDLIKAIATKSNWDSLLKGTINGKEINETRTENVWAMGGPTLDLYVSSWNSNYPNNKLYLRKTEMPVEDEFYGYYIGTSSNPSTISTKLPNIDGDKTLYSPHSSEFNGIYAYWLSSLPANFDTCIMATGAFWSIGIGGCTNTDSALRPIICLPSNVLN